MLLEKSLVLGLELSHVAEGAGEEDFTELHQTGLGALLGLGEGLHGIEAEEIIELDDRRHLDCVLQKLHGASNDGVVGQDRLCLTLEELVVPLEVAESIELASGSADVNGEILEEQPLILDLEVDLPIGQPSIQVLKVRQDLIEHVGRVSVVDDVLEDTESELHSLGEDVVEVHEETESELCVLVGAAGQDFAELGGALVDMIRLIKGQEDAKNQGEEALNLLHTILAATLGNGTEEILAILEEELENRVPAEPPRVKDISVNSLELFAELFLALIGLNRIQEPFGALCRGIGLASRNISGHYLCTGPEAFSLAWN
mmetsp:Transcript_11353/g.25029  ORF Transcript_11353/g.25029 Transcript_11353/m.25029 type:complete len:316 (+) Transcript_11353:730-1677(+)